MKSQFAPSLMCMDYLKIKEQIGILNDRADLYHADLMDGHYCRNITMSPDLIAAVCRVAQKPVDVHLMTTEPMNWIEAVAKAGVTYISPHAETINTDAYRVLNRIRELGCRTGIVLNPATPLSYADHYLNRIDLLTVMTIDVGFAGQPFIEEMLDKVREAGRLREENGYTYRIQIDGSCNEKTYRRLYEAGAEIFIVGNSGLFHLDPDLPRAWQKMREIFQRETSGRGKCS